MKERNECWLSVFITDKVCVHILCVYVSRNFLHISTLQIHTHIKICGCGKISIFLAQFRPKPSLMKTTQTTVKTTRTNSKDKVEQFAIQLKTVLKTIWISSKMNSDQLEGRVSTSFYKIVYKYRKMWYEC